MAYYGTNLANNYLMQRRVFATLFGVFILFYLAFHAISGERGVLAMLRETAKLESLKKELLDVKSQRESLEKKVEYLSDNNLDLDLLDEQSRIVLGMAGEDEVVVFLDK